VVAGRVDTVGDIAEDIAVGGIAGGIVVEGIVAGDIAVGDIVASVASVASVALVASVVVVVVVVGTLDKGSFVVAFGLKKLVMVIAVVVVQMRDETQGACALLFLWWQMIHNGS